MKDFNVEGVGRAGGWMGVSERSGGRKYVAGVSASPGHCSLSITSIVRYREAGEKREVGIHAEFPVFVVAAGLFFPPCSRPERRYQITLVWTGDSGWSVEGGLLSLRAWPSSVLCFNAPYFSSPRHLNGALTLHPHLLGKSFWPYQAPYSVCPLIFEYSLMSSRVCMMVYQGHRS